MRIVVAAMFGLLVASITFAASGAGGRQPSLTAASAAVRGAHFTSRERVAITFAAAGQRVTRHAHASVSGSFATPLPFHDPCLGSIVVVARGAAGDSARLKLPQRACAPALQGSG